MAGKEVTPMGRRKPRRPREPRKKKGRAVVAPVGAAFRTALQVAVALIQLARILFFDQ